MKKPLHGRRKLVKIRKNLRLNPRINDALVRFARTHKRTETAVIEAGLNQIVWKDEDITDAKPTE